MSPGFYIPKIITRCKAKPVSNPPAYPPRRLFVYGHQRSTNPANFVKIDPVDVEIIGLTKITKIYKTTAKRKPSPKRLRESG